MKSTKIYASGNMTPRPELYYFWIGQLKNDLDERYDVSESTFKNPQHGKLIVRHDLARLKECDILVINLGVTDTNHHLTGAVVEVYEAYKQGIPVYAFTTPNTLRSHQANSPWMSEFIAAEFDSYDSLVNYLNFDEVL